MTIKTLVNDMLTVFQDKEVDLSFSLKEINQSISDLEKRRHNVEGKLTEVQYTIRYLEQSGAGAVEHV